LEFKFFLDLNLKLQDLEPNINCEVPYDAASFEKHLLKAEAAISMQTRRALEIQRAIQEMTLSYNKIVLRLILICISFDNLCGFLLFSSDARSHNEIAHVGF